MSQRKAKSAHSANSEGALAQNEDVSAHLCFTRGRHPEIASLPDTVKLTPRCILSAWASKRPPGVWLLGQSRAGSAATHRVTCQPVACAPGQMGEHTPTLERVPASADYKGLRPIGPQGRLPRETLATRRSNSSDSERDSVFLGHNLFCLLRDL